MATGGSHHAVDFNGSFYKPARGGHAPGDLRDAFSASLEAFDLWEDGEPEPTVELRDKQVRISEVCGLLWNCSDTMPSTLCSYFSGWDAA